MKTIWSSLFNADLSSEVRELWWQISHQVISTNVRLHKFKLVTSNLCEICHKQEETIIHSFFQCPTNFLAHQKLNILLPHLNQIKYQDILDLRFEASNSNRYAIVVSEYLYSTWCLRNNHIFRNDRKTPDSTANLFLHRLRVRIKADFYRLERTKFLNTWRGENFPITINDNGELFIGF